MSIYLKDATYLDWQSLEVRRTHISVEPGPTGGIAFPDAIPQDLTGADTLLDCAGKLVTKSFGCGHHHIYSTLARGMPAPPKIPKNFVEILKYVWWHMDKRLDLAMIESCALAAAIHMAKNGVTFVIDHHASPFAPKDCLFTIAEAFDRVGISHMLCYELSDRDGEESTQEALAETEAFLAAGNQGHVGLHASFTVGDELMAKAVDLAGKYDAGIHLHVAEDRADQEHCLGHYGKRVVQRLKDAGVLDLKKSILSHCIHLDQSERELARSAGIWVAQNTESNQNNNVGLTAYDWAGQRVMLGTDGLHSDMIRSAKAAFLAGQATESLGYDAAYERFRGVDRYAQAVGAQGHGDNNLLIMDYDSPTELTSSNFLGHFIFGLEPRQVESVIAKGRLILDKRHITGVDEASVLAQAKERAGLLWDKMQREL